MPFELQRLKLQLDNLKIVLEEAVKNNTSFLDQAKIAAQIKEVEHLIEKRQEYIKRQNSPN